MLLPEGVRRIVKPEIYPVHFSDGILALKWGIMKREVLVIIDMVNGFVKFGALSSPIVAGITPNVVALIKDFKARGKQIVTFSDCHGENDPEFAVYPPHCIRGTEEASLIPEIAVFEKSILSFEKNCTDGMQMDEINQFFTKNEFDSVTIAGCCTDICVQQFAVSLKKLYTKIGRKTAIIVPKNAVATFDAPGHPAKEMHEKALAEMKKAGILVE
jgi:nicotinamidase-related amidase